MTEIAWTEIWWHRGRYRVADIEQYVKELLRRIYLGLRSNGTGMTHVVSDITQLVQECFRHIYHGLRSGGTDMASFSHQVTCARIVTTYLPWIDI